MAGRKRRGLAIPSPFVGPTGSKSRRSRMNDQSSLEMTPGPGGALAPVPQATRGLLLRMFADPHVLEEGERLELVEELRACVQAHPAVAELRVVYGMAHAQLR